jgi:hypothetical protein
MVKKEKTKKDIDEETKERKRNKNDTEENDLAGEPGTEDSD